MLVVDYLPSPPVGLITPDALSLCLFTLLQQLGHERVNEASGPPRPGLVQATGKCAVFTDHVRPRWVLREGGGCSQTGVEEWAGVEGGGGVKGSSVIDHTPQHCNKQMRAINAKVINQTWSCTVLIGSLFPARVSRSRHITLTLSKTQQTDLTVCSLECTAPNWTSLSGTPLVVHQPHRQRQKKNSTSSHLSTPGVDTHTRGLLKYSDRES